MLPSALVVLGSVPLTPNGKVDLAALPAPAEHALPRDGASLHPRNAIEVQLMRLWEQLLRIEPIGMEENFFDLGGHSLLAVQLMDRIAQSSSANCRWMCSGTGAARSATSPKC